MAVLQLAERKEQEREDRLKCAKESIDKWFLVNEVEELVVIAKLKDSGARTQIPLPIADRIWWVGALEMVKGDLIAAINDTAEYDKEEGEDGE